ncbi:MAG: hypothetical protein EXS05_09385 [Planctomycetaceae bacterium]|nr:hypothetical protein [Planctomycetaceae bacterium]
MSNAVAARAGDLPESSSIRVDSFRALYARELRTITAADLLGLERELLSRSEASAPNEGEIEPVEGNRGRDDQRVEAELTRLIKRWEKLVATDLPRDTRQAQAAPPGAPQALHESDPLDASRVTSEARKIADSLESFRKGGRRGVPRGAEIRTESAAPGSPPNQSLREDEKAVARARDVVEDLEAYRRMDEQPNDPGFTVQVDQATGEPFVTFVESDRVGLALSGGGIRSATFNLGLLQGLDHHKVLNLVDYLSTVSGGGYIGGWWSTWKFRNSATRLQQLPVPPQYPTRAPNPPGFARHEANEVRHLREFSNFLVPRAGFFDADVWDGVAALLSGMTVSLFLGASLLFLTVCVWLSGVFLLVGTGGFLGLLAGVAMGFVTLAILVVSEGRWQRASGLLGSGDARGASATMMSLSLAASIVAAMSLVYLNNWLDYGKLVSWHDIRLKAGTPVHAYLWAAGPAIAWGLVPVLLLVIRPILDRFVWSGDGAVAAAFARLLGRLLRLTLFWAMFAATWEIARYVYHQFDTAGWAWVMGVLLAAAEAFRRVRNWVSISPSEARTGSLYSTLKPLVPQVLAYLVIFCGLVLVTIGMVSLIDRLPSQFWLIPVVDLALVGLVLWLVDPEQLGLRAIYRRRIVRTYLGASNPLAAAQTVGPTEACYNRCAIEHPQDDLPLSKMQPDEAPYRPIHLVCCAANDLTGDQLSNLGRGSQSAVLSPLGMTLGDYWRREPSATLGAALTASAAAFNPLMGSISRQLGPAVTFLLAALNLRLGLWVQHPATPPGQPRDLFPGWRMLTEFWSDSRSGMTLPPRVPPPGSPTPPTPAASHVHLSDGGHFENLGLYELVRRHCRYIIVSDCGADPESVFDDLGNALRRIREDFGVEIELDITPLKPGQDNCAAQHMVVGTIHYDTQCDYDQGIILYFKPTVTGDEPDDVLQYKTRNTAFPQETTVDQFDDEKQWEAYRRLGEHTARSALRFLEGDAITALSRYRLFSEAYWRWYPTVPDQERKMLDQTERFSRILAELRESGANRLIHELLPEADRVQPPGTPVAQPGKEGLMVMEIAQVMEDAFIALLLDRNWTSPLYSGWMNLFYRWTRSSMFRDWWPSLESLYSRDFRSFLNDHCRLAPFTPGLAGPAARSVAPTTQQALEHLGLYQWYRERKRTPVRSTASTYNYLLEFHHPHGQTLPVGFLEFGIKQTGPPLAGPIAEWFTDELFVTPSLRGTNIAAAFLPEIIRELHKQHQVVQVEVELPSQQPNGSALRTDQAHRAFRSDLVRLYKSLGFKLRNDGSSQVLVYKL